MATKKTAAEEAAEKLAKAAKSTLSAKANVGVDADLSSEEASRVKAAQVDKLDSGETYLPEETERHLYHLELEKKDYTKQGVRLSKPFIQKFTENSYEQFMETREALGYTGVSIIWDPKKYV